jgi:hypothetical protein
MARIYTVELNLVPRAEIEGHVDNNFQTLRPMKGANVEVV